MTRFLIVVTTLLLWAVMGPGADAFWNKKKKDEQKMTPSSRPRRRLMEVPIHNADVDAATGTVTHTEEELAQKEQAKSCDGQMAQALVAANDATFQAEQARDDALESVTAGQSQIEQLESSLQTVQADLTGVAQSHTKQVEDLHAKLTQAAGSQDQAVQIALDAKDQELAATKAASAQEIATLESQADKAAAAQQAAIVSMEEAKDAVITDLKDELENSKGDVQKEIEAQLSQVQAEMERQVAQLQSQLEATQVEHTQLLETTKEEAKLALVEQVNAIKSQTLEKDAASQKALAKQKRVIQKLKAENDQLSTRERQVKDTMKEHAEEIAHWRATHANRTYCNMTYISDDLYETTVLAYNQTTKAASVAAAKTVEVASTTAIQLNQQGQKLARELSTHAGLGWNKSKQIYSEQYEKHWPKVKPHYEQHVSPLVEKVLEFKAKEIDPKLATLNKEYQQIKAKKIDPRLKALNTERKLRFQQLAQLYGAECYQAHKMGSRLAKEHDFMAHFQKVSPAMKDSCDQAERSVSYILRFFLVLILLPFSGRIFGFAWSVVRLVWNILLTVTLLRFILPRGSSDKRNQKIVKEEPVPPTTSSNGTVRIKRRPARGQ